MSLKLHLPLDTTASLTDVASGIQLNCTRAEQGHTVNSEGWFMYAEANEPRFIGADFRQNLCRSSGDPNGSGWVNQEITVAETGVADGVGGRSGWKITENTATNYHRMYQAMVAPYDAQVGHNVMWAVDLKYIDCQYIQINCNAENSVPSRISCDVQNGVVASTAGTQDSGVTALDNGWYRFWLVTGPSEVTSSNFQICMSDSDTTTVPPTYTGTSRSVYVARPQALNVTGSWVSQNFLANTLALDGVSWTKRGVCTATGGQTDPYGGTDAFLIEGLNTGGSNDIFQSVAGKAQDTWYGWGVWMKQATSTTGTLNVTNPTNANWCSYNIDISQLSGEWEYVTPEHAAVTKIIQAQVHENGGAGWHIRNNAGGSHDIYLYNPQIAYTKPRMGLGPGPEMSRTTGSTTLWALPEYIETPDNAAISGTDGSNDGLLIEPAATNISLQSRDFTTTWTSSLLTVENSVSLAPDGSKSMAFLNETASTGDHYVRQAWTKAASADPYCNSIYAKGGPGRGHVQLMMRSSNWTNYVTATFDLINGTIDSGPTLVGAYTTAFAGMEDVGNGVYRCWVSATTDTGTALDVLIANNNGSTSNYLGVVNQGIYVWGHQLEAGAEPTSIVHTSGGTASRSLDNVYTTDMSFYDSTPFSSGRGMTAYIRAVCNDNNTGQRHAGFSLNNATFQSHMIGLHLDIGAFNRPTGSIWWGAGQNLFVGTTGDEPAYGAEYALAFSANDGNSFIDIDDSDGTAGSTHTTALTDPTITRLDLYYDRRFGGATGFHGLIKEVAYADEGIDADTVRNLVEANTTVDLAFDRQRLYNRKKERDRFRRRYRRT